MTTYVLAGGCFWCLDAIYRRIKGISEVVSGYTGGRIEKPTYHDVSRGDSGHAEAIQVTFDESVIPSDIILDMFFLSHDPTSLNRQGADVGTQYRSAMFYADESQKAAFESALGRAQQHWDDPIVTEIKPLTTFYDAEAEHQDYYNRTPGNPYCSVVINPKIAKVRASYAQWFKEEI